MFPPSAPADKEIPATDLPNPPVHTAVHLRADTASRCAYRAGGLLRVTTGSSAVGETSGCAGSGQPQARYTIAPYDVWPARWAASAHR